MSDVNLDADPSKRPPGVVLLGSTYGLLWTLVVVTIFAALDGSASILSDPSFFPFFLVILLACVPTAVLLTWIFGRWLPRLSLWTVVPLGLLGLGLALMAATFIALNLTCLTPDGTNVDPQFRLSHWEWVSRNNEYMLRMMFGVAVMTVAPPILAVLNCWDLRRRMMKASTRP
jgi:hypothetical protein